MSPEAKEDYAVDGLVPGSVERPDSVEELSRILAEANSAGEAVIPWGGGTRMGLGNLPERYDVAVDLSALNGVVEYEPADLTVVVRGGITVAALQAVLAESSQRLLFDPADTERATIGGSLASNAAGPIRSSAGGIRDLAIGMKVVEADGTVTKSGGKVVKNVQGFDLVRLHIGALGTLGIIVEVAFKVAPLPADSRTVAGWFDSVESARDAAMRVFNGSFQPEATSVVAGERAKGIIDSVGGGGEAPVAMLVRVSGGFATVERQVSEVTSLLGAEMADGFEVADDDDGLWAMAVRSGVSPALSARATFKPADAFSFVSQIARQGADAVIHVGTGTVISDWGERDGLRDVIGSVAQTARRFGAETVFERCPTELKADSDVWGTPGPSIGIMRRMKEQFDPKRTLNPGRFIGRI